MLLCRLLYRSILLGIFPSFTHSLLPHFFSSFIPHVTILLVLFLFRHSLLSSLLSPFIPRLKLVSTPDTLFSIIYSSASFISASIPRITIILLFLYLLRYILSLLPFSAHTSLKSSLQPYTLFFISYSSPLPSFQHSFLASLSPTRHD